MKTKAMKQKSEKRSTEGKGGLFLVLLLLLFSVHSSLSPAIADDISAKAAIVYDSAKDRILYAKNPNLKVPPASTTKLLTAMVVMDRLDPEAIVTVSETAAAVPSVSPHLRAGERFTVKDLLCLSLMRSINGAAVALAEAVGGSENGFVRLMNEKAVRIGAENTAFINASGLPGHGQYITAYDLAKVMKASLDYPLIKEIINTRTKNVSTLDGRRLFLKNTNQLLWTDDDLIGGKTGYTREARHCFVCAARKSDTTMVSVVLGEAIRDNLWEDSKTLLSKGNDILNGKAEPMIYLTTNEKGPVVFASYSRKSSQNRKVRLHNNSAKMKGQKVAAKKYKKKRHDNNETAAKKGKKRRSNLSVQNHESVRRS